MSFERELILNIKGTSYPVEFPNIGKFQKIESLKQLLSNGLYSGMMQTSTISSSESLDMIDMEAYFTVLIPKLMKDLKPSFSELGLEDYMELKAIYREKFLPWWINILSLLNPKTDD